MNQDPPALALYEPTPLSSSGIDGGSFSSSRRCLSSADVLHMVAAYMCWHNERLPLAFVAASPSARLVSEMRGAGDVLFFRFQAGKDARQQVAVHAEPARLLATSTTPLEEIRHACRLNRDEQRTDSSLFGAVGEAYQNFVRSMTMSGHVQSSSAAPQRSHERRTPRTACGVQIGGVTTVLVSREHICQQQCNVPSPYLPKSDEELASLFPANLAESDRSEYAGRKSQPHRGQNRTDSSEATKHHLQANMHHVELEPLRDAITRHDTSCSPERKRALSLAVLNTPFQLFPSSHTQREHWSLPEAAVFASTVEFTPGHDRLDNSGGSFQLHPAPIAESVEMFPRTATSVLLSTMMRLAADFDDVAKPSMIRQVFVDSVEGFRDTLLERQTWWLQRPIRWRELPTTVWSQRRPAESATALVDVPISLKFTTDVFHVSLVERLRSHLMWVVCRAAVQVMPSSLTNPLGYPSIHTSVQRWIVRQMDPFCRKRIVHKSSSAFATALFLIIYALTAAALPLWWLLTLAWAGLVTCGRGLLSFFSSAKSETANAETAKPAEYKIGSVSEKMEQDLTYFACQRIVRQRGIYQALSVLTEQLGEFLSAVDVSHTSITGSHLLGISEHGGLHRILFPRANKRKTVNQIDWRLQALDISGCSRLTDEFTIVVDPSALEKEPNAKVLSSAALREMVLRNYTPDRIPITNPEHVLLYFSTNFPGAHVGKALALMSMCYRNKDRNADVRSLGLINAAGSSLTDEALRTMSRLSCHFGLHSSFVAYQHSLIDERDMLDVEAYPYFYPSLYALDITSCASITDINALAAVPSLLQVLAAFTSVEDAGVAGLDGSGVVEATGRYSLQLIERFLQSQQNAASSSNGVAERGGTEALHNVSDQHARVESAAAEAGGHPLSRSGGFRNVSDLTMAYVGLYLRDLLHNFGSEQNTEAIRTMIEAAETRAKNFQQSHWHVCWRTPPTDSWRLSYERAVREHLYCLEFTYSTTLQDLNPLHELPLLQFLNIAETRIGHAGIRAFARPLSPLPSSRFMSLRVLVAESCEFDTLDPLAPLPGLEKLYVRSGSLTTDGLVLFGRQQKHVQLVDLSYCDKLEDAVPLAALPRLRVLVLDSTEIMKAGVRGLVRSPSLEILSLRHCFDFADIGPNNMPLFEQVVGKFPKLHTYVYEDAVGDEELRKKFD